MDECVQEVVSEGLFEQVRTLRRHVVEQFDNASEALEEADSWENLRLPAPVRRRLRETDATPVELVDTVLYRLFRKRRPSTGARSRRRM
jgi:hypothetical protein